MINLSGDAGNDLHAASRISYTHIDGEIKETEICHERRFRLETLEDYFQRSSGIAEIDCVGTWVWHDGLCRNQGEISGQWLNIYPKPQRIKWSRKG